MLPVFRMDSEVWVNTFHREETPKKSSESFRWWSLLLQPVSASGAFERVGFGEVMMESWMKDPIVGDVYLV